MSTKQYRQFKTVMRVFNGISGHLERHPRDGMARVRLDKVKGLLDNGHFLKEKAKDEAAS